ncbi:MAG: HTTM domain-containing protein [Flavobacteriales bacterium]|nr:HTTM domain-containing protein [Bacteroidota bacterium]MCB9241651.1 HTTM domain-containing protein [Flavobacteriales bacterium]
MIREFLFKPVSSIPLSLWRILFGIVLIVECFGSILVGYTHLLFITPPVASFNFIGFDWMNCSPGYHLYGIYIVMGLLAVGITLGWKYRWMMSLFTVLWWWTYLMHKVSYNNHHYLMGLICILMTISPAVVNLSLDSRKGSAKRTNSIPGIYHYQFVALLFIVYTYAAMAKLYPDWLHGVLIEEWFKPKHDFPVIGGFYRWAYTKYLVAWGGIAFDFLVIPALIYKPTRNAAFVIGIFFHVTNSITFQIGTFPYMMIASAVFFYPESVLTKRFRLKPNLSSTTRPTGNTRLILIFYSLFFLLQIALPLRHHLIPGDVLWTEEGHRLSWRMMLRSKSGYIRFTIVDQDGNRTFHDHQADLSEHQAGMLPTHPDLIWQYCQRLKRIYGDEAEIYVRSRVSLNYREAQDMIDPTYNMAKASWHPFRRSEWVLDGPDRSFSSRQRF